MGRILSWKVFVIVILSAFAAVAPLVQIHTLSLGLWDDRPRLILYFVLTGLGVTSYCLRYYRLVFASGLASAVFCAWAYLRDIWQRPIIVNGLMELVPSTRADWGWLVWLASALFLCGVAIQEGLRERQVVRRGIP